MNTNETLAHLQSIYPELQFSLDTPQSLGVADMYTKEELKEVPKEIIYFVSKDGGIAIWDAYASECSRFQVQPTEHGISEEDGKLMLAHNKVSIGGIYEEIINPKRKLKV